MFRQVDCDSAPVFYSDSQGVVALLKNPVHQNASKFRAVAKDKFTMKKKNEK